MDDDFDRDRMTAEDIAAELRAYEAAYGLTSADLLALYAAGKAPDEHDIHAWLALLGAFDGE